ncbi:MAG TPA: T9SS type A sorting domain-containing protein [Bacteroidia bacterium]|nr:T9SS type A sorting domain-containing protein [Bacteroidia bacterium]HNB33124.1 T9SS type A sorting domain-containing protein [Bacteroidia bacterium]HNG84521.1 T9SS type A sorting domain-containing protein [Bacteroidia bacterium]HRU18064.1 T9SS type A sorting domain-containing protein [Bacteroidia bacterium]
MKKYLLLITIYCFLIQTSEAQINLVPNPSFEDTVACPTNVMMIDSTVGWSSYRLSPDYFNSCNQNGHAGVPANDWGYQYAKTGDAYAGIVTYAKFATDFREMIGIQLLQALTVGQKYYLSFYVNNSRDSSSHYNAASNKMGAKFLTTAYSQASPIPIDNFAHIYSDSIITDSINWIKISGSFIANLAYQYLAIGNFFSDSTCTHILLDSLASMAYYYIDDVKLSTDSDFVNSIHAIDNIDLVQIFPNPARDWIVVEGRNITSIEVFDLCGKLIIPKITVSSFKTQVDISTLSYGVYIVKTNTSIDTYRNKFIHF